MNRIPFDPYDFFGYLASGGVVLLGLELLFGFPKLLGQELSVFDGLMAILGAYVAGQIVATPAKALLEDILVGRILRKPSSNLFREKRPWFGGLVMPGYFTPLPQDIRRQVLDRVRRGGFTGSGEELFLFVRFNAKTLQNERLMTKLNSFVNKYGFARNLSFTCLLIAGGLVIKSLTAPAPELGDFALSFAVVGVLLFYRYLKFFRQYSYELFNVFGGG